MNRFKETEAMVKELTDQVLALEEIVKKIKKKNKNLEQLGKINDELPNTSMKTDLKLREIFVCRGSGHAASL